MRNLPQSFQASLVNSIKKSLEMDKFIKFWILVECLGNSEKKKSRKFRVGMSNRFVWLRACSLVITNREQTNCSFSGFDWTRSVVKCILCDPVRHGPFQMNRLKRRNLVYSVCASFILLWRGRRRSSELPVQINYFGIRGFRKILKEFSPLNSFRTRLAFLLALSRRSLRWNCLPFHRRITFFGLAEKTSELIQQNPHNAKNVSELFVWFGKIERWSNLIKTSPPFCFKVSASDCSDARD